MRQTKWYFFLSMLLICSLLLCGCTNNEPGEKALALYDAKTQSLDALSDVQHLSELILEDDYGSYSVDMRQTTLYVTFQEVLDGGDKLTDQLYQVGAAFLCLIQDCTEVDFSYRALPEDGGVIGEKSLKVTMTRAQRLLKADPKTYVESAKDVQNMLEQLKLD